MDWITDNNIYLKSNWYPMSVNKLLLPFLMMVTIIIYGCGKGSAEKQGADTASADSTIQADSLSDTQAEEKDSTDNKDDEEKADLERIPVEVQPAVRGDISQYLQLSSNLRTEDKVSVFPEMGGIVRAVLADEGDKVNEGDTLLILDDEEKILDRDAALLDYRQREAEFKRAADLREKNLISAEEFDQAKFNMESRRIQYERASLTLRRTRVLAPISGYIAERMVNRGDLVNMSTQLYRLVDPTELIVEVHIPEAELPVIDHGKKVEVATDVYPEKSFPAKIKRIAPVVEETSGTFRVTIGIHDKAEILKPGMFVNVKVITSVHRDVVLVPKQAVLYENDLPFIYVVEDTVALKLKLTPGYNDSRHIESLEGIQPGDKIVVVGQSGLKDSATVKIIDLEQIRREAMEMARANGEKLKKKKAENGSGSEADE